MRLTKQHARKVLEVIDAGLVSGLGKPEPGQMCVMAAINYALGEDHGDSPSCVHPVIRMFDIRLNDSKWSSSEARAKGMRREAIAKLGSTNIDGRAWVAYVAEQHIRRVVPIPLRIVAVMLPDLAERLEEAAKRCEAEGTKDAADAAAYAAYAAADAAANAAYAAAYAAANAAYAAYAAKNAAANAANAADAAAYAADAAAYAAKNAAYAAYAAANAAKLSQTPDEILTLSAEIATEACIKFKTQGSKWLDILN